MISLDMTKPVLDLGKAGENLRAGDWLTVRVADGIVLRREEGDEGCGVAARDITVGTELVLLGHTGRVVPKDDCDGEADKSA